MRTKLLIIKAALVAAALIVGGAATAQEQLAAPFEHQVFSELLSEAVHVNGLVDYELLAAQRPRLDRYINSLKAVQLKPFKKWTPAAREAFWINAYNAYTIRLILDNYPVDSIKDIGGFFSSVFNINFIDLHHLSAAHDEALSLGELEHEILGKQSRRPLFHFAIVCASAACPELRNEAYVAERLDAQLEDQARIFLADKSKNDLQIAKGKLYISKIFDWSEDELNSYKGGIKALIADFAPLSIDRELLEKTKLRYRSYDWSLNIWHKPEVDMPQIAEAVVVRERLTGSFKALETSSKGEATGHMLATYHKNKGNVLIRDYWSTDSSDDRIYAGHDVLEISDDGQARHWWFGERGDYAFASGHWDAESLVLTVRDGKEIARRYTYTFINDDSARVFDFSNEHYVGEDYKEYMSAEWASAIVERPADFSESPLFGEWLIEDGETYHRITVGHWFKKDEVFLWGEMKK